MILLFNTLLRKLLRMQSGCENQMFLSCICFIKCQIVAICINGNTLHITTFLHSLLNFKLSLIAIHFLYTEFEFFTFFILLIYYFDGGTSIVWLFFAKQNTKLFFIFFIFIIFFTHILNNSSLFCLHWSFSQCLCEET